MVHQMAYNINVKKIFTKGVLKMLNFCIFVFTFFFFHKMFRLIFPKYDKTKRYANRKRPATKAYRANAVKRPVMQSCKTKSTAKKPVQCIPFNSVKRCA